MNALTKWIVTDVTVLIVLFLISPYYYEMSPLNTTITKASAIIHPTKGNTVSGKVTFTQEKQGVRVRAQLSGLTPGKHGIHIHEFGDCGCDDAVCAGQHFNPTKQPHGGPTSKQRHVGDFGNIVANQEGEGLLEFVDKDLKLNGRSSCIGRSIIIHAQEDDLASQPSGNAGDRIGCGNIGIAG